MGTPFFMPTIVTLFLLSIATWRVSYMFINEDGPFDIFIMLRSAVGIEDYDDGSRTIEPHYENPFLHFLAGVFSCIYCLSVWVGFFLCAFYASNIGAWFLYSMLCSTAAIFINIVHESVTDG